MNIIGNYKLSGDDKTLADTHVRFQGASGITGSVKGGYVDRFTMTNCIVSGFDDTPGDSVYNENWGARVYNLRDAVFENSIFRNIEKEHGPYFSHAGNVRFQRCLFHDIGSQGIQSAQRESDLFGGRADNVACLLEILQCKFDRCATPWGRRQSWNLSIFAFDEYVRNADGTLHLINGKPHKGHLVRSLTDVVIAGCDFTGNGYEHTVSGNRQCASTGAILVQDRMNLDIRRCTFNYERPDREIIQIRNVADAYVAPIELNGGDLVLHAMDNCKVTIAPGRGDGMIRRRAPGSHTSTLIGPITAGYSH